jgi:transposase
VGNHRHCKHYIQEHKENIRLNRIIREKDEELEKKDRRIAHLEKKLQYYENPNSPPSANSLLWKKQKKERREQRSRNGNCEQKKPGRKKGHKGVSHAFKPTETIEHKMDRCNRCGSPDISFSHHDCRPIVDVPEPEPYTVKLHKISIYNCNNCGSEVRPDTDIPEHGDLGKNLLALITTLWSEARLPPRRIDGILKAVYNLDLSAACINNALVNVSESLRPFVDEVREEISSSDSAGFDETSMPVNGDNAWAWAAVTEQCAFITIEHSRRADVLEKHFHAFDGIAIVDGWKAYNIFDKQQRCWAHIIRDADTIALRTEDARANDLASSLKMLYHDIKAELKERPPPNWSLYLRALNRFRSIVRKRYSNIDVRKFVAKLKNAGKRLFTFIMHNVQSTNNDAERVLREVVIHRKIRAQLRTEKGMKMFGNIMTAVMTWKRRGLNMLEEVRRYL